MAGIFTSGCAVTAGAWIALIAQGPAQATPCPCVALKAYVDCSAKAKNGKGTRERPYDSLRDLTGRKLGPGTVIRFKRGATCEGTLNITTSGSAAAPIVVGAYGEGAALPKITAKGAAQAVLLGGKHIRLTDLELTAPGGGKAPRYGVLVRVTNAGTVRGVVLRGLDIHDVRGQLKPGAAQGSGASGGIVVEALGRVTPTSLDGLKIRGNLIHSVDGQGIQTWSNWCRRPDLAPEWKPGCTEAWKPFRRLRIRGNLLWDIGGAGIAVSSSQGAAVEGNQVQGFGGRVPAPPGAPTSGIGVANSAEAVVGGNEVSGGRKNAIGFAIGGPSLGATVEHNLSHHNDGGFACLCAAKDAAVRDFAVRGNISLDDRARAFAANGPASGGTVHGNTVVIGPDVSQLIVDAKTRARLDVRFAGNLIARAGEGGTIGWNLEDRRWRIEQNLLHGVPVPEGAKDTVSGDPLLLAGGAADPFALQLRPGSPALGSAAAEPPPRGYPLSPVRVPAQTPNIGAIQAPATFATGVADTFASAAALPGDWKVTGDVALAADQAGFGGRSMTLGGKKGEAATAVRAFPPTGGAMRANARLWIGKSGGRARLRVLDADRKTVAEIEVRETGVVAYSDGEATKTARFPVPAKVWTRVSLLLRPDTASYDIAVGGAPLATATLAPSAGLAAKLAVEAPAGAVSADDILVTPEICVPAPKHHGH